MIYLRLILIVINGCYISYQNDCSAIKGRHMTDMLFGIINHSRGIYDSIDLFELNIDTL